MPTTDAQQLPDQPVDVFALGLFVRVFIDDPDLREIARALWADCHGVAESGADFVVHVTGSEPWHIASDAYTEDAESLPAAVGSVCAAINVTFATRTPLLAVHAAVVCRNGSTILIPGQSGAGKTTLTVALLQSGFAYATDEAFAVDWESAVAHPYPRPMGVSDWTAQTLATPAGIAGIGERFLRATDLDASVVTEPLSVDHIVLLDRSASVTDPILAPVHRAEALEVLLHESFTHYYSPERAVRRLADVVESAQTWTLSYSGPLQAAGHFRRWLGGK
jgi:hypothetical protein